MRYEVLMWTGTVMVMAGAVLVVLSAFWELFSKPKRPQIDGTSVWEPFFIEILKDKRSFLIALGLAVMAGAKYALS